MKKKSERIVVLNLSKFLKPGMTTRKLAEDLGMNPKAITGLRKGTEKGEWETLILLSEYFDVSIEELFTVQDKK